MLGREDRLLRDGPQEQQETVVAVGLQCEILMENSSFPSRPSSPLPSMQGRKTQVSNSGRRPSLNGANTQAERAQTPMTASKLVKRKSLGVCKVGIWWGHDRGEAPGKCPSLGLCWCWRRHVVDSDVEEGYGDQQQQHPARRILFSRLILHRDKSKDRDDHKTPVKEGVMGSVTRISLVGRDKRVRVVGLELYRLGRVLRVWGS